MNDDSDGLFLTLFSGFLATPVKRKNCVASSDGDTFDRSLNQTPVSARVQKPTPPRDATVDDELEINIEDQVCRAKVVKKRRDQKKKRMRGKATVEDMCTLYLCRCVQGNVKRQTSSSSMSTVNLSQALQQQQQQRHPPPCFIKHTQTHTHSIRSPKRQCITHSFPSRMSGSVHFACQGYNPLLINDVDCNRSMERSIRF